MVATQGPRAQTILIFKPLDLKITFILSESLDHAVSSKTESHAQVTCRTHVSKLSMSNCIMNVMI